VTDVIFGYFQINPAAIIKIDPRKSCGGNLIRISSERSDSLAFHVPHWRGIDGGAGSKWTSGAEIARQELTSQNLRVR
jgi:hypothetical protein